MPAFTAPIDIINRALQHVGSPRRGITDNQKNVTEGIFAYDKLREQELNRNTWVFATKRSVLRSVGVDSLIWSPPAWTTSTWSVGSVVSYTPTSGVYSGEAIYWQTNAAKTTTNTTKPDSDANWQQYFGPTAVDLYDSSQTYHAGEITIVPAAWASGTTYAKNAVVSNLTTWYVSLQDSNTGHSVTSATTFWTAWTSAGRSTTGWGETTSGTQVPLTYPGTPNFYLSLVDGNADNPLTSGARWLALNGTGAALDIVYPIGAGPSTDPQTAYVFYLPYGYMRRVASDPKAGVNPVLGAPAGPWADDWLFEGGYIVSRRPGPIMLRYIANVLDVSKMNAMFCEGLAIRIALDSLVESLTQSSGKKGDLRMDYNRILGDARLVNAIETGWQDPPEDDFISARY